MQIIVMNGNYYIPIENGCKPISEAEVMTLWEQGFIDESEVVDYD